MGDCILFGEDSGIAGVSLFVGVTNGDVAKPVASMGMVLSFD